MVVPVLTPLVERPFFLGVTVSAAVILAVLTLVLWVTDGPILRIDASLVRSGDESDERERQN